MYQRQLLSTFFMLFQWNELITTLPGLYFFSVGALKPLQWVFGHLDDCSMLLLRSLSLVKGFGIFLLLHLIIAQKYPVSTLPFLSQPAETENR